MKIFAHILAICAGLVFLSQPVRAFIANGGSGGTSQNSYHADNIDFAGGNNVVLNGSFSGAWRGSLLNSDGDGFYSRSSVHPELQDAVWRLFVHTNLAQYHYDVFTNSANATWTLWLALQGGPPWALKQNGVNAYTSAGPNMGDVVFYDNLPTLAGFSLTGDGRGITNLPVSGSASAFATILSTVDNTDYDLSTTNGASLVLDNVNGGAQSKLMFTASGVPVGGVRVDYGGNFSWTATGGQGHQFYTQLDGGSATYGTSIGPNGFLYDVGGPSLVSSYPFEVKDSGHATAGYIDFDGSGHFPNLTGLTTNIQVLVSLGGLMKTLNFTNGLLQGVQ